VKSSPDFQRFIEEGSPSGVKGQDDIDYCDTERSRCSTHRRQLWCYWTLTRGSVSRMSHRRASCRPCLSSSAPITSLHFWW